MNFLNSSFRVGRLAGIDIRVHILFLFYIAFEVINAGSDWEGTFVTLLMLFGIVLLHEFGHCFGAISVGGFAPEILIWPLGGLAMAHHPKTPWAQFVTVAAGPAVNLIFCLVSAGVLWAANTVAYPTWGFRGSLVLYRDVPIWAWYLQYFYRVNYMLLVFNLLPIYPMDGGRLLETLLWPFLGLHKAMHIACTLGLVGAVGLGLWGMQTGGMMMFIALFGGFTCWQQLQMLKYGMVVDERIKSYDYLGRYNTKRSWWSRLFGRRRAVAPDENPNPGGWDAKLERERKQAGEVDRILQKVHEKGINSLSYIERQTLERATRAQQENDDLQDAGGRR